MRRSRGSSTRWTTVAEGRRLRVVGRDEPIVVEEKEDLLDVLQRVGVPVRTSCGGVATCGLCRVTVVDGAKVLTPFKGQEELHLGNVGPIVGLRLACQSRFACDGEVRIDVPPVDDVQARKRRKVERFREAAGKGTSVAPERVERQPKVEWRPRKLEAQALATLAPPAPRASMSPPRASARPGPAASTSSSPPRASGKPPAKG